MGLDSVELLMAMEDEFGVRFDDADAMECITPGHAANYIFWFVRKNKNESCPSQRGFHKIRKLLHENFNIKRNDISPELDLINILGHDIRKNWQKLQDLIGVEYFPPLEKSISLRISTILVPSFICFILYFFEYSPLLIMSVFIILNIIFNLATSKLATHIPKEFSTVAKLIPFVGCSNDNILNREQILIRVIEITSEQLGIPRDEIKENSHFVKDLGID